MEGGGVNSGYVVKHVVGGLSGVMLIPIKTPFVLLS